MTQAGHRTQMLLPVCAMHALCILHAGLLVWASLKELACILV